MNILYTDVIVISESFYRIPMTPITEAEVLRIARSLLLKGEKVSVNKIRDSLGHGSYSTILEILEKNGIRTAKNKISRKTTEATDMERLEILTQLQKSVIREQCRNESLREKIRKLHDPSVIENIILLNLVKTILVRHLSQENRHVKFMPDDELKWKFLKQHADFSQSTIDNMERMLIEDFLNGIQSLKNNMDNLRLNGGYQSLMNIEKMLRDLLNRNKNDGVYNY